MIDLIILHNIENQKSGAAALFAVISAAISYKRLIYSYIVYEKRENVNSFIQIRVEITKKTARSSGIITICAVVY